MYDLKSFREQVKGYCQRVRLAGEQKYTLGDLAAAIGLARAEFSRRLNGSGGSRLTCGNAQALTLELIRQEAITRRTDADRLLTLVDCPPLADADLRGLPLAGQPSGGPSATEVPNNLPLSLTTFIGRVAELQQCRGLLTAGRLLTITGAGGIGKTRFALELATQFRGRSSSPYPDGIWLLTLQVIDTAHAEQQLTVAVAAHLGITEQANRPLLDTLLAYLRERTLLLIFDNCEHIRPAAAALAARLLRSCAGVSILATSRESLGVAGEVNWQLLPLPVPPLAEPNAAPYLAGLRENEAVRLFVNRAQQAMAERPFDLTTANAATIVAICVQLEGIPLALELAAARVRWLPLDTILARLNNQLRLLRNDERSPPSQQQTLRASIAWSYDLLDEAERQLFARLAVFNGGCSLESAEAICANPDDDDLSDVLGSLVNKSLVLADVEVGRYRLLEVIRQFAAEKLKVSGEEAQLRQHQLAYFHNLTATAGPYLVGPQAGSWLARLAQEQANLRVALAWAQSYDHASLLDLSGLLGRYWHLHGDLSEGLGWLTAALQGEPPPSVALVRALSWATILYRAQGKLVEASILLDRALPLAEQVGDLDALSLTLTSLGHLAAAGGDYELARQHFTRQLTISRQLGDQRRIASALAELGQYAAQSRDYAAALPLLQEAVDLKQAVGDPSGVVQCQHLLADTAYLQGDYEAATTYARSSLQASRELGSHTVVYACTSLIYLGRASFMLRQFEASLASFNECRALAERNGIEWAIAAALAGRGAIACVRGDFAAARRDQLQGLLSCQRLGLLENFAYHLADLAWAVAAAETKAAACHAISMVAAATIILRQMQAVLQPLERVCGEQATRLGQSLLTTEEITAAQAAGAEMTVAAAADHAWQVVGQLS